MTTAHQPPRTSARTLDRPARPAGGRQTRPGLRGLPSVPRRLSGVPFGLFIVLILGAGTVGLLTFITFLQNQSFEVRAAERAAAESGYRVSDLEARLYAAEAPRELARRATELGMAPNPHGAFIDLETGTVVGDPTAVRGDEIPSLKVLPPPPPEPETPLEAAPIEGQPAAEADAGTPVPDVEGDGASPDAAGAAVDETGGDQTATGEGQP
ncbi:MAG: hypothetical protein L0G22_11170 [Propionibacteriaceae bacterium]|nr:hypothetical protein [Propionibacteriaceae bacterium]